MTKPTLRELAEAHRADVDPFTMYDATDMDEAFLAGVRAGLDRAAELADAEAASEAGWTLKYAAEEDATSEQNARGGNAAAQDIAAAIRAEKERV